jgi:hypothetical protein
MRVTKELHGQHFFVKVPDDKTGKMVSAMTPLFLALVVINLADLVFAVDSVPAIFAITTDTFIVYTSNIMAILGLRALYFALAAMVHRFHYLKYALAAVLVFIGSKIFVADFLLEWWQVPAGGQPWRDLRPSGTRRHRPRACARRPRRVRPVRPAGGAGFGHFAQGRIVEDHIGRHPGLLRQIAAQRAQGIEQRIADRVAAALPPRARGGPCARGSALGGRRSAPASPFRIAGIAAQRQPAMLGRHQAAARLQGAGQRAQQRRFVGISRCRTRSAGHARAAARVRRPRRSAPFRHGRSQALPGAIDGGQQLARQYRWHR